MYWHNLNDFLHMGGYALYVWVSFAATFGSMAIEVWLLHARRISSQRVIGANQ
jgi:heme exporter protein CcmD